MDQDVNGMCGTYVLIDATTVGDWYQSPNGPDITKNKTEMKEVPQEVAWAMTVFRDDVRIYNELDREGSVRAAIDYSESMAPRVLTQIIDVFSKIEDMPNWLEYSKQNSTKQMDMWV